MMWITVFVAGRPPQVQLPPPLRLAELVRKWSKSGLENDVSGCRIIGCDMTAFIDPHIHMISRTTDDYVRMSYAQCAAVSEPAFWAGFDRGNAIAFHDYFRQLTGSEPKRAVQFNIRHYAWLCI